MMAMADIKQRLSEGWLRCRAVIELVGKPREHIEKTMRSYVDRIKQEKHIEVIEEQIADLKKMDTGAKEEGMLKEMWATFAELDMLVKDPMTLTYFCFDFMPSSVEIVEPEQLKYSNRELTEFFNDLQARLHQLDMIAKQMKSQVIFLQKSTHDLLKNYVSILLSKQKLSSEQLAQLTGVNKDTIEDFLDTLIDKRKVTMEGEKYMLVNKDAK